MYQRLPHFAGTFYPDDSVVLTTMIENFLRQATVEQIHHQPKALIVPHAGYVYSGPIAAYGFKILLNYRYEKILLLGPSHHFAFSGLIFSPSGYFQTPLGQIETIGYEPQSQEIHEPEHCLEVELPFLQTVLTNFKIIPCLTGELNIKKAAPIIDALLDEKTLLVVSSDLSHYYSYHEAQQLDKVSIDAILDNDLQRFDKYGEACGKTGIEILMEISKKRKWQVKLLKSLNSGDITGEKEQVVGYASLVFY